MSLSRTPRLGREASLLEIIERDMNKKQKEIMNKKKKKKKKGREGGKHRELERIREKYTENQRETQRLRD